MSKQKCVVCDKNDREFHYFCNKCQNKHKPVKLKRQGDVYLKNISLLPKKAMKIPFGTKDRTVAAHGETGNTHQVEEQMKLDVYTSQDVSETLKYLEIKEKTALTHEEHTKIDLEPNELIESDIQRTYQLGKIRRISD